MHRALWLTLLACAYSQCVTDSIGQSQCSDSSAFIQSRVSILSDLARENQTGMQLEEENVVEEVKRDDHEDEKKEEDEKDDEEEVEEEENVAEDVKRDENEEEKDDSNEDSEAEDEMEHIGEEEEDPDMAMLMEDGGRHGKGDESQDENADQDNDIDDEDNISDQSQEGSVQMEDSIGQGEGDESEDENEDDNVHGDEAEDYDSHTQTDVVAALQATGRGRNTSGKGGATRRRRPRKKNRSGKKKKGEGRRRRSKGNNVRASVASCQARWAKRQIRWGWSDLSEKLGVICCATDGSMNGCKSVFNGLKKRSKAWRQAKKGLKTCRKERNPSCQNVKDKTFTEAEAVCASKGLRLCKRSEVNCEHCGWCKKEMGHAFRVWTSTTKEGWKQEKKQKRAAKKKKKKSNTKDLEACVEKWKKKSAPWEVGNLIEPDKHQIETQDQRKDMTISFEIKKPEVSRHGYRVALINSFEAEPEMLRKAMCRFTGFKRYAIKNKQMSFKLRKSGEVPSSLHKDLQLSFLTDGTLRGSWTPNGVMFKPGCYRSVIITGKDIIAVSKQELVMGPSEMTLCNKPVTWTKVDTAAGSVQDVSTLTQTADFRLQVRRFQMDKGVPGIPLGGFKTHYSQGHIRPGRAYLKGTSHITPYKQIFRGTRSDGREGVVFRHWNGDIKAVWFSQDLKSYDSQTIYNKQLGKIGKKGWRNKKTGKWVKSSKQVRYPSTVSKLAAVAFGKDDIILFVIFSSCKAWGRFVRINSMTGTIIQETGGLYVGYETGIGCYGAGLPHMASMAYNYDKGLVGLAINGQFDHGHQGSYAMMINVSKLRVMADSRHKVASHSTAVEVGLASDGSFFDVEIGDNFPRGIAIKQFGYREGSKGDLRYWEKRRLPYSFKTGMNKEALKGKSCKDQKKMPCKSNDNQVYTELGRQGLVETDDAFLLFFSGERPPLGPWTPGDRTPRNIGVVKMAKDPTSSYGPSVIKSDEKAPPSWLRFWYPKMLLNGTYEKEHDGKVEEGHYYNFRGDYVKQKNEGIVWLTNYTLREGQVTFYASRVKTARLAKDKILLYWEVWSPGTLLFTQVMIVDDNAQTVAGPWKIDSVIALPMADNIHVEGGRAVVYAGGAQSVCDGSGGACKYAPPYYLVRYEFCFAADCGGSTESTIEA